MGPNSDCEEYLNPAINQAFTAVEGSGDSCDTLSDDDQNFETAMVISPIPTRSVLNIATQLPLDNAIFTVYDLTGKIVINGQMNSKTIDVSSLSTGNYILRIMSKEFTKTQKFIKQ